MKLQQTTRLWKWRTWLASGLLIGAAALPRAAHGQYDVIGGPGRNRISGAVLIDGDSTPASRVRVEITALSGGDIFSTFTDASGRFEAATPAAGAYVVKVVEQGYEPVEERVDSGYESGSGVMITLHRYRTARLPEAASGYTVSVRDLKVPGKARHAFEKGLERMAKQDFAGGLGLFKEATDAFPDYYEAYYQAGLADMELRRDDEAEQAFQRSIDLSGGGYADAQFALGALLCDKQQYAQAETALRHAIDVNANSWKGHLFLGQALFGLGRLVEAEKSVREALLRKPDIPSAYIVLANVHIRRHEYILGVQDLDTYLNMKPSGPTSEQAKAVREAAQRVVSRLAEMGSIPQLVY
jgi:tetratricopeptide (TPR) repeat protein